MRVLEINRYHELEQLMHSIKVDPYAIKIMAPKALAYLIKINSVSNIAANILKQEILSLGGDAAIAKDAITGKIKKTDCLLIANLSQFRSLHSKLSFQPFGLAKLAQDISLALANYRRNDFTIELGKYKLNLEEGNTRIMGIVNLTPDSFSGDGLYKGREPRARGQEYIVEYAEQMVKDGADLIDIGGESARPGAKPVSLKEELGRVIPALKALVKKIKVPISVDTYKPEVAKQALSHGAVLVNDITGLRNPRMAEVIAEHKASVIIMHMKGTPQTMQKNPGYASLIDEVMEYLNKAINTASSRGIDRQKIIIDPGIGFGKTIAHNLEILKGLKEFKVLGRPVMIGVSRKSFIGKILNAAPQERLNGTVACCCLAAQNGANILRVHDVKAIKQALKVTGAVKK